MCEELVTASFCATFGFVEDEDEEVGFLPFEFFDDVLDLGVDLLLAVLGFANFGGAGIVVGASYRHIES